GETFDVITRAPAARMRRCVCCLTIESEAAPATLKRSSCPRLSRASTSYFLCCSQDVDGRVIGAKQSFFASPGHDESDVNGERTASLKWREEFASPRPKAGRPEQRLVGRGLRAPVLRRRIDLPAEFGRRMPCPARVVELGAPQRDPGGLGGGGRLLARPCLGCQARR